jgi:hypothetical protein
MFFSHLASFAVVSTLFGIAIADFQFLSPGGPNLWWGKQLETRFTFFVGSSAPLSSRTVCEHYCVVLP